MQVLQIQLFKVGLLQVLISHLTTWLSLVWPMQTAAEAEAKQADIRAKHLKTQLSEQRKALESNKKEARQLQNELDKQKSAVWQCQQG